MSRHYPSLLLVCNGYDARWYEVQDQGVKELAQMRDEKGSYSDREGFFMSQSGSNRAKAGEPEVMNQVREDEEHKHFRAVAEKTKEVCTDHSFAHVSVAVPEQHKHLMAEEIKNVLPQQHVEYVYGNYTNTPSDQMHELFLKSIRPPEA